MNITNQFVKILNIESTNQYKHNIFSTTHSKCASICEDLCFRGLTPAKQSASPITVSMLRKNMNRSLLNTYNQKLNMIHPQKSQLHCTNRTPSMRCFNVRSKRHYNLYGLQYIKGRSNTNLENNRSITPIKTKYKFDDIKALLKNAKAFPQRKPLTPLRLSSRATMASKTVSKLANIKPHSHKIMPFSEFYKVIVLN